MHYCSSHYSASASASPATVDRAPAGETTSLAEYFASAAAVVLVCGVVAIAAMMPRAGAPVTVWFASPTSATAAAERIIGSGGALLSVSEDGTRASAVFADAGFLAALYRAGAMFALAGGAGCSAAPGASADLIEITRNSHAIRSEAS